MSQPSYCPRCLSRLPPDAPRGLCPSCLPVVAFQESSADHARGSPEEMRPGADFDRNLLHGILALRMDFISRDALFAGMNAWVLEKSKPLGQILVAQGVLE